MFVTNNKDMFTVHIHKDKVRGTFLKYHYWFKQKKLTFSSRKKTLDDE